MRVNWRSHWHTTLRPASVARSGGLGLRYPAMFDKTNMVRDIYHGIEQNLLKKLKIKELFGFEGLRKKEGSQKTTNKPGMYMKKKGEKMDIEMSPAMLLKNQHVIPLIRGC